MKKTIILILATIFFCFSAFAQSEKINLSEYKIKSFDADLQPFLRDSFPKIAERCQLVLDAAYMAGTYIETNYNLPNWQGFPVKLYEYETGIDIKIKTRKKGKVYMLNPSAQKLAMWVITTCWKVKHSVNFEYTNKLMNFVKWQSGAQFPVSGVVYEDMYTKGFYEPYVFKDGVTVYVADSTKFPADKHCTEEQLDFYLHLKNSDLKPNTGRYARICSTNREQYYNNGGRIDVGASDNNRKQAWLSVVRNLYQQAWNSDFNELMIAWAKMNL